MDINNGFKELYSNTGKLNLYNEYQTLNSKKDKTEEELIRMASLISDADVNCDGFVNSKDKKILDDLISNAHDSKNKNSIYDFDGDNKLSLKDLLVYNTEADIDGDGVVSDEEKAFLQTEQKNMIRQLKNIADKDEYDLNGDGKVDKADVVEFLNLTSNIDFRNADKNDQVANYLKTFQDNLNLKTLDTNSNMAIDVADLAYYNELLNQTQNYLDGKLDKYLSDTYKNKNFDINGDGEINEEDINFFKAAIKSIEMQIGKTVEEIMQADTNAKTASENLNTATNNKKEKTTAYNNAKTEKNAAQQVETKAKNELNNAKAQQKQADNALAIANKNLETAQQNYDTAKNEYNEILEQYNAAETATDKRALQNKLNSALTKYHNAEKSLNQAKDKQKTAQNKKDEADAKVAAKQAEYDKTVSDKSEKDEAYKNLVADTGMTATETILNTTPKHGVSAFIFTGNSN